jgi:hypothetical protein
MSTNRATHLHVPCEATPAASREPRRGKVRCEPSRGGKDKAHPGRPRGAGLIHCVCGAGPDRQGTVGTRAPLGCAGLDCPGVGAPRNSFRAMSTPMSTRVVTSPLSWDICRQCVKRDLGTRALIRFAVDIGVDICVDVARAPCRHAHDRYTQSPLHLRSAGRRQTGAQRGRSRCAPRALPSFRLRAGRPRGVACGSLRAPHRGPKGCSPRAPLDCCRRSRYPAAQRSSNPPLGPGHSFYSIAPPCAR